jgi:hypothetical protein
MSLAAAAEITPSHALSPAIGAVGIRWRSALRMTAVACLLGAEVIHALAVDAHRQWLAAGVFFAAIAAIEGLLGVAVLVVPSRRVCLVAAGVSAGTVAVWLVSRTTGLPVGPTPGVPEAVAAPDSISTLLEALTVGALVPLVLSSGVVQAAGRGRRDRAAAAALVAVIALLTVLAARSPEPRGREGHHALGSPHATDHRLGPGLDA